MRKTSDSARASIAQAPAQSAYRRASDAQAEHPPWDPYWTTRRAPDVASFVAEHGVTLCPPGRRTPGLAKPVSDQRRKPNTVAAELCWAWRRLPKKKKPDLGWMKRGCFK
jgi:hypothetical protein